MNNVYPAWVLTWGGGIGKYSLNIKSIGSKSTLNTILNWSLSILFRNSFTLLMKNGSLYFILPYVINSTITDG